MQQNNKSWLNAETEALSGLRRHRLMQICVATAIGLLVSFLVSRGITKVIFAAGVVSLLIALYMANKHRVIPSATILLSSMSAMLFALSLSGAGLFDLAILGYPGILIFAAILGGVGLFAFVLVLVITQCLIIVCLTLEGIITPNVPILSWLHLVFVLVIFIVTGFSVYILVKDIKRLMLSLHEENLKVEESHAQIEYLAHHDTLTKLANRLYGETIFNRCLKVCQQKQQSLAVLFIDLDNFKPVNDALGHAAGDELLVKLTQRIQQTLSKEQYLIRFGGDEFLVFSPISNQKDELNTLAQTTIEQCSSIFEVLETQVVVSASIGIAQSPDHGIDFKELCRKADIAMYKAKEDGRNTFHHYHPQLDKASDEKFKLLQLMRPAIRANKFILNYQPMIDLTTGDQCVVEALLRWPQEDGSFVGPDQFIPIAEQGGLINELGAWVLQEACLFCAQQRQTGLENLRIAVNLSVMQFKDGCLQSVIEHALSSANLPAEALELELTESLLIDDTEHIQKQLLAISQLGITIAIDDFGTGYSNLGYLRNFNASKLKIDRSFVRSICTSKDDENLVSAIIGMAGNLGLLTVAEGIEDKASLEKLTTLGCDIGQGYYWSKPVAGDELISLISKES
ncbi:putative bifunctional diguanylate cyclase/phosphodiesterase [Glaciecola petra]|uniref:EAL domain-containing protein n=1 Tax=Glaciecola petra TaxID=3075602 RepID=A0ABU2ZSC9_9ALTE|nr:EAL domain-containing protein [Aestuariibacter sp. P117]MDT0595166.1 EAL domain-containing protein [Aestuariibacter sp. P117]